MRTWEPARQLDSYEQNHLAAKIPYIEIINPWLQARAPTDTGGIADQQNGKPLARSVSAGL
jgi:hypothetical protein